MVTRFDDLADVVRDGDPRWVGEATAAAFGMPGGLSLLVVPVLATGETLGALLLLFDEEAELTTHQRRLLRVVSAIIGFALVRERVAGGLRDPSA
jgi:GAF domain-containing protein